MAMVYLPMLVAMAGGGMATFGHAGSNSMVAAGVVLGLVGFIVWCWLTIMYVSRNGQTIAKKLLSIKVVRTDGSPASIGRLFWLRNVVNGLISLVPLYGFVDMLFIFGESRQCLHDKIAGTIVVKA
jgi:uncharacterized RDD family membrane protein YckC